MIHQSPTDTDGPTSHHPYKAIAHTHLNQSAEEASKEKKDAQRLTGTHPAKISMCLTLGPTTIISTKHVGPREPR